MTILISERRKIFGASSMDGSGAPADSSALDWISTEGRGRSQWKNSISGPVCLPSVGGRSLLKASIPEPPIQGSCSQATTNPGTGEQILATGKHPFCQLGTKSLSPQEGRSSADIPSLPSSGSWLWNGLYSLQSHQRAPLRGQVRDSISSHRLSIYDNVPPTSLLLGSPSSTRTSWEGSLPGDSVSTCAACRASNSSALDSLQTEGAAQGSLPHSIGYLESSTEQSDTTCFSSSSSELKSLAAASRDSAACSGALQSLVVELKAELSKQRTEYEASIKR